MNNGIEINKTQAKGASTTTTLESIEKTVTWSDCGYTCTFKYFGAFTSGGKKYHVVAGDNTEPNLIISDAMFNQYYTIN